MVEQIVCKFRKLRKIHPQQCPQRAQIKRSNYDGCKNKPPMWKREVNFAKSNEYKDLPHFMFNFLDA